MIVSCPNPSCGRRIGVNLGYESDREEVSGLLALAQSCARHRINGREDCAAAKAHADLKLARQTEEA